MSRFNSLTDIPSFDFYRLTLILYDHEQISILAKTKLKHPMPVWLKCDTGMHRLGIALEDVSLAWKELNEIPWIKKPIGLMTHLACADEVTNSFNQKQIDDFLMITQSLSGPKS